MTIRAHALAAAALIAALGLSAGTASADSAESVGFTATSDTTTATITIDNGSMSVEDGVFRIESAGGKLLAGTELRFRVDDFVFPIHADISASTATLTPRLDPGLASYQPVALPFEDQAGWRTPYEREQAAWARMASTIGLGISIGALVGGIGGAAVGCVLGGLAGATVAAATIVGLFGPFLPAAALGCLGGAMAAGALGTIAGQLLVSAPVALAAVTQYFATIYSPMPASAK
ncbi:hypothetical protein IU470_28915 [Nocardia abscessus]|uniref:DUF8020 domain-containing protein n=1 Tax=Nocardia abscessus TaxID=120957 RepID=A0ABS0CFM1_9NOCA|nr:hypothetical protein [Nocardia abscessus]MBF6229101.1 hypothetical protein [Nocardia abscessus]